MTYTATVGDLFGDADDISSDEEVRGKRSDAEGDEGGSDRERQVNEYYTSILYIELHTCNEKLDIVRHVYRIFCLSGHIYG